MKKYDNFVDCLSVLEKANFSNAYNDEIYRMGVIGQFNLTFELSWKALQAVMRLHGVSGAEIGSPREILKLGYANGFIKDSEVWLLMLSKRNENIHIYDDKAIDELIVMIRDSCKRYYKS
ncbi:nucleotidyltransferase substrate binding protein, HI0074 family [Butyrivibrio hungatei]|uniref:Nucleotidyltransferase substrate binding protein, HI0074 family n=1 Tax=Butyrivibrio hungatei TaxID=185008 RepID=A0A1G5GVN5_9FIRM|nr:HI0074 family nucleotidyltransferase substrate-binding subunit [Butyrivibrio hungatei]SCY55633.1 nucleotidyltransferase substrate binding protein, HI0074 family [Butyrivibrio hungatei]